MLDPGSWTQGPWTQRRAREQQSPMPRMQTLFALRKSIIAALVVAALGLLSMGILGLVLYYLTYPLHYPLLGDIDDWEGTDLFWPSIILAGMLWAVCFPVAGYVDLRLKQADRPRWVRRAAYLAILWLGAGLIWLVVAMTSGFRFPTAVL